MNPLLRSQIQRLQAALPETRALLREGPALTLGLCGLLALVLLGVQLGWAGSLRLAQSELAAVVDFAIHHPAVEVDPRLVPAVQAVVPSFDGNATFAFLRETGRPSRSLLEDQEAFDVLAARALAGLDAHPQRWLGLVPARSLAPGLATHWLVHGGWVHGLATLALLLLLAPLLERTWGRWPLAALIPLVALCGGLAFAGVHWGAERPLVGASPLVAAVTVAALVRFWGTDVDLLHWLPVDVAVRLPCWTIGVVWLGYAALLQVAGGSGLPAGFDPAPAWPAEAAAAAVAALGTWGLRRSGLEERFGGSAPVLAPAPVRRAPAFDFERVRALRASGQAERAYALLQAEVGRSARNRDAVVTFFEMSVERGEPQRALPAMRQLVSEELRRGAAQTAASHWRSLCEHVEDTGLAGDVLLRLVGVLREEEDEAMALVALRQVARRGVDVLLPSLAVQLAEHAAPLDANLAAAAARRGLEAEGLHPDRRRVLEALARRAAPAAPTGLEIEPEAPLQLPERKELPGNAFYDEQDRSMFGEVAELTAPGDEERLLPAPAAVAVAATQAVPIRLAADRLLLQLAGRGRAELALAKVRAVATAGVRGLGPRPVVLIDLLVAPPAGEADLRVVRLRSDTFDPTPLAPGEPSPLAALRAFAVEIARRAGAETLPSGAERAPLAVFESLAAYECAVLLPRS